MTIGAGLVVLLALSPMGWLLAGARGAAPLPVTIASSVTSPEAGIPVQLAARVSPPGSAVLYNWSDSFGASSRSPVWNRVIHDSGSVNPTMGASDRFGDRGVGHLTLQVRPSISVSVSSPLSQVDAGVPAPFFIDVSGGVPPMLVNWTFPDGSRGGAAVWEADGNRTEVANFSSPGPGWVLVRALDGLGDQTSVNGWIAQVMPPGSIVLATGGSVGEVGLPFPLAVEVEHGAPPFRWSLSSSLPLSLDNSPDGVFSQDGSYRWNISFAFSGVAFLNLTAVDAVGDVLTASSAAEVEPPLAVRWTNGGLPSSPPFVVVANLSGGLAPYAYQVRLSDGEVFNGTLAAAGVISTPLDPPPNGNYSVQIRVTDVLGQTSVATEPLRVEESVSPPTDPSASGFGEVAGGGVLAVTALLVALVAYRRWGKARAPPRAPEDSALPTVRQLMQQSQIIDRETLLLLSEEAGESTEAAQRALQALIRTGEVTTEPGPTNDDVLRWKGTETPGGPSEGSP